MSASCGRSSRTDQTPKLGEAELLGLERGVPEGGDPDEPVTVPFAGLADLDTQGFTPILINIARQKGVASYLADGTNRWPAVNTYDAATLFRLAIESAPAGSRLSTSAGSGPVSPV